MDSLVPDDSLTIDGGAVAPWNSLMWSLMTDVCREMGVRTDVPFRELTEREKEIVCLDDDEAGQKANKGIYEALFVKGIKHEILAPIHKDWNEDLLYPNEEESEEEGEAEYQALQL